MEQLKQSSSASDAKDATPENQAEQKRITAVEAAIDDVGAKVAALTAKASRLKEEIEALRAPGPANDKVDRAVTGNAAKLESQMEHSTAALLSKAQANS